MSALLSIEGLTAGYGGLPIIDSISLSVAPGEIVVVIGKTGRSIPRDRAMDHVLGYCLANDVSQRDLQRRHGAQWFKGKSIDGASPIEGLVDLALVEIEEGAQRRPQKSPRKKRGREK